MTALVLLDRDGVLNVNRDDYVKSPAELVMIDGAAAAVARLNAAGKMVAVVTNQSAVGRGIIDQGMLDRIHDALRDHLRRAGARVEAIFACTDPPWAASDRRKPGPGMIREALRLFRVAPDAAVMIGDSLRDLQAARTADVSRILVRTGHGAETQRAGIPQAVLPVAVHESLTEAVDALLGFPG
jgi:D-glycero-D-manno-heptose 1,7-bisphosphate phosphatase